MNGDWLFHEATLQNVGHFLNRPVHGVLLTGAAGLGKTHLAKQLVAQLAGISPVGLVGYRYLRVLAPQDGTISIESVRELPAFLKLKTGAAAGNFRRFIIIEDADSLTTEAQNALLLLLEEPPADTAIILTSARSERLLPTVRSRLQLIPVVTPPAETILQYFQTFGFPAAAVQRAWLTSGESIAATLAALQSETQSEMGIETVKQILAAKSYERLLRVDSLARDKPATWEFVTILLQVAQASLHQAAGRGSDTFKRWHSVLQAAHTAQAALEQNGNAKLVLTELMLNL